MNSVHTAFWKLLTLSGVIASGCFVALQVQEGLGTGTANASPVSSAFPSATVSENDDAELGLSTDSSPVDVFEHLASLGDSGSTETSPAVAGHSPIGTTGNDPFFANVPEADFDAQPVAELKSAPTLAGSLADEPEVTDSQASGMLAQANPFDFPKVEPGPTVSSPTPAPRPFEVDADKAPKRIGRVTVPNLTPQANLQPTPAPMPEVTPRGAITPIPTQPKSTGPMIIPAGANEPGNGAGLQPIPDPFDLGLPPVDDSFSAQPRTNQPAAQPFVNSPASAPVNDPFVLDLEPAPVAQPPVQSASAQAIPEPVGDPSFGRTPLPEVSPSPLMADPLPEAVPDFNFDPSPVSTPSPSVQSLTVGQQPKATASDFVGAATIDRDVARGPIQPHIRLSKSAPPKATLGKPLVYEIVVTNIGDATANEVIVEDRVPLGTTLDGTNPIAEMPQGSKKLVWRFDTLAPGESKRLKVRVTPTEPGKIGSIATVKFVAEVAAETQITAPQLRFNLAGDTEAILKEQVRYSFELINDGDEDARDVVLFCRVPEGLKGPNGEPELEYPVGTLPAGSTKTVDLPLEAISPGRYTTEAWIEAPGISQKFAKSPIHVIKSRLSLDRSGPGKRYVGSRARYVNHVTNTSAQPLTNVRVTESLPANVEFASADNGGSVERSGNVVWIIDSIAPGTSKDLSVTLIPKVAGDKTSLVNASGTEGSRTAIKAMMSVVGYAAMDFETDHENRPYSIGETISLQMTIKNGGTASARTVATTVTVPEELRFLEASGPARYTRAGNAINFASIDEIPDGRDATFSLTFEAVKKGDARLSLQLQSTDLDKPLIDQVSIRVLDNE